MNTLTRTFILFVIQMVCCENAVYAEFFSFRHYEVQDGLPSNTVRSLTQDSRGFMWFGTDNGLSRFDGYVFKNFKPVQGDSTSLGNRYIYAIYEDSHQILWIGTDDGIYLYNPELEQFSFFSKLTGNGVTIKSHINSIQEDNDHNLWFSSLSQGVFFYHREKDVLHNYVHDPDNPNSLASDMILALYIDHRNNVWAAPKRKSGVLNRFERTSNQFVPLHVRINDQDLTDFGVYAMTEDSDHNFWLGTWNHGLCKLDKNTGKIESFLRPGTTNAISHIHEIMEYQAGILLVGSDDGLAIFNTRTHENELMTSSELKSSTLSDKFVYPIFKDGEGGLWVGTYYGGVNYAPPLKGNITGYSHSKYKNSVSGNIVSCFTEDTFGHIWIGSDDGGLSHFDPEKKTFVNYMPDRNRNSLSYHNIHALCLEGDKLWIGTYSGGLNVLNLKTKRFQHYHSTANDPYSLYSSSIYSIYKDSDGEIWLGTMEGICMYNRENDNFLRIKAIRATVADIVGDTDGCLWFATWGMGIFCYDKNGQTWHQYLHNPDDTTSIPHNQVNTLHIDAENKLWIGTDNGLAVHDKKSNTFSTIPLNAEYSNICYIRNIREELWIATSRGLINYVLSDGSFKCFYKSDGLQSDQFSINSGLLSSSGELYLGTTKGFNIIKPENIAENEYIPPVYITNFQIFNKSLKFENRGVQQKSAICTKTIELSHKENVFSIEYVALSYKTPAKNQYKYWLEGFDKNWNEVGSQRRATYMNLPAGKYFFHVKGSNNNEIWNEQGVSLAVIIYPPFWRTTMAYVFYVLFIIAALALFIYQIQRKSEKEHKIRMQQLQAEKDRELHEAKINFFTFVAHEIRTPVSLIIGPLEIIMDNIRSLPDAVQDSLPIINRNSQRLLSLVNQLLDFRKAEDKAFSINFSYQNLYDLLHSLYIRFKPLAEQNNITLLLEIEKPDVGAIVDAEALTKIVSNLLTNAIKHAQSRIIVSCVCEGEYVTIKVTDDGPGIQLQEQKNIFLPFYQIAQGRKPGTGLGLSLVKLLVDAHHGMVEVESVPGKQTAFIVTLPKHQNVATENPPNGLSLSHDIIPHEQDSRDTRTNIVEEHKASLLIVEDSSDMLMFLSDSLRFYYKVLEAKNGKDALEMLKKYRIDIIVSDIMMPEMNGIEFTREMKNNIELSHIPVILLTAKTDTATKLESMHTGADAYIEKPFSLKLLQAQIENLLKSRMELRKKFSEMPFIPLNSVAGNKSDKQFLDKMNHLIENNIANPDFSVDILAGQLCISRSGLFTKMKSLTGMTPNELIQLIRLKKAAELLAGKELRINEICYKVGFNNPSYFSKCFQKRFGMLPKDFANAKKNL
ncbi:MAG: response regulator [Tannerellaceae bacterium]|jgi:ligand-binding sensor domain-containing protein/signal transduction histidine kinase/AraC-like DNA-binding protein|nr:response regulator [Tannerellaceae bacterium]